MDDDSALRGVFSLLMFLLTSKEKVDAKHKND